MAAGTAWVLLAFAALLALPWKLLCAHLRKRRALLLSRLSSNPHAINASVISLEFPFLFIRSLEMATFRTFAIPSISAMLKKSGQYASNASKRYDDTQILLEEMLVHHLDSCRGSLAVRRLNFLHSHYAITNADYLYVLCLGMVVPPEWAARYGYREWTELEKMSAYKAWHDMAVRMGLQDIPASMAAAAEYREEYEARNMVYAESNKEIAELNMKLLVGAMPELLQPITRRLVYALMDDRFREALGYPKQPAWLIAMAHSLLQLHGAAVRWMPPRPLAWAQMRLSVGCPAMKKKAEAEDEAVLPLAFQRYKPVAYQNGYRISELGPHKHGVLGTAAAGELLCPPNQNSTLPKDWINGLLLSEQDDNTVCAAQEKPAR